MRVSRPILFSLTAYLKGKEEKLRNLPSHFRAFQKKVNSLSYQLPLLIWRKERIRVDSEDSPRQAALCNIGGGELK